MKIREIIRPLLQEIYQDDEEKLENVGVLYIEPN